MKIVTVAEVEEDFGAYLEASRAAPIVITRNNRPVALLLAIDEEADLNLAFGKQPALCTNFGRSERVRVGGGIPLATFRKQIEQDAGGAAATYQVKNDPLIGLFAGPPDLSEQCEAILEQAAQEHAGWTLK